MNPTNTLSVNVRDPNLAKILHLLASERWKKIQTDQNREFMTYGPGSQYDPNRSPHRAQRWELLEAEKLLLQDFCFNLGDQMPSTYKSRAEREELKK